MNKKCKFEECGREVSAKGYCKAHYDQSRRGNGELTPVGSTLGRYDRKNAYFDEEGYKVCTFCKEKKHKDDYYNLASSVTGKTPRCKVCTDKSNAEWREANPDKSQDAQRRWREANEGRTYLEETSGYVRYIGYNHPAANPSGISGYHRIVLWDKLDGQDTECHWGCGTLLRWDKSYPEHRDALVTDHLNGIRSDNRPENLVASCASCNASVSRLSRKETFECSYEGCERDAVAKGLCKSHHQQKWLGRELSPLQKRASEDSAEAIVEEIKRGERITKVAAKYGYNESSVSRLFKRATGTTIRAYRAGVAA